METLRGVVIVLRLISFAMLFGAWFAELLSKRRRITALMQWGMAVALVTGMALAAPWGLDGDLNYMKIGVKLAVLVVIGGLLGIGGARQRKEKTNAPVLFWSIGLLTLLNTGIAVLV